MARIIGYDCPSLTPRFALLAFLRVFDAYTEADRRCNAFEETGGPLDSDEFGRLEQEYLGLVATKGEAEARAVAALEELGCDLEDGAVRVDGRLLRLVQSDELEPKIVVALTDVVDLN